MTTTRNNRRKIRTRLAVLTATAIAAIGLAGPPSAGAAASCKLANGVLSVEIDFVTTIETAGDRIAINTTNTGPVTCSGGTPTTTNVDVISVVDVRDKPSTPAPVDGDNGFTIKNPASFAPGLSGEAGTREIEWAVNMNGGEDQLQALVADGPAANWTVGEGGINWNGDADADLTGIDSLDIVRLNGNGGEDRISAQGGLDTGGPIRLHRLQLFGFGGDDELAGGQGRDIVSGGAGNDRAYGHGGDDALNSDAGNDTIIGGPGTDDVSFRDATRGVTVDLAAPGPQETGGAGVDLLGEIEGAYGTLFDDRLAGDAGPNGLAGAEGDDVLHGRGGADVLYGNADTDTVTYDDAPGRVSVDLFDKTAVQGTDVDAVFDVENVIGSPFGDELVGDGAANRIVGGAGADTIRTANGADRVEVRDGEGDRVSCGDDAAEVDSVIADHRGVDQLGIDCESVELAPDPQPDPGPGPEPAPDTSLSFTLSGAKAQRLLKQRSVIVKVRSPLEAVSTTVSAKGAVRVAQVRASVAAGATRTLKLRLAKAQLASIRRALAAKRAPTVKVTAEARDAAGNVVVRTLRVRAKR